MDGNTKYEERLSLAIDNIKQDIKATLSMCEKIFTEELVGKLSKENYEALNFYLTACVLCLNEEISTIDVCYDAVNMMFSVASTLEAYVELDEDKKLIEISYKLSSMNFANLLYCAIIDRNKGKGMMKINEDAVNSVCKQQDIIRYIMSDNKEEDN